LNIHASLLPRWRGAAPIHRAIEAGDPKTGVGIMQMESGLDTGPILLEETIDILPRDTTQTLHDRLAELGAQAILKVLDHLQEFRSSAKKQSGEGVLYASKIQKQEALINWTRPAKELERQIRAFTPSPGSRFKYQEEIIKVGEASLTGLPEDGLRGVLPGTVLKSYQDLQIMTGEGVLSFSRLQRPGGKMLSVQDFLAGCPIPEGSKLD
jgi:methionyl-tRNA formyltransferase